MNRPKPRILRRTLSFCLAVLLAASYCAVLDSCGKGKAKTSSPTQAMRGGVEGEYDPMERASTLTGIYRAAEVYSYPGENLDAVSLPDYDPETGELAVLCTREEVIEQKDENGDPILSGRGVPLTTVQYHVTLRTLLPAADSATPSECVNAVDVPIPEGSFFQSGGVSEKGVWAKSYGWLPDNPFKTVSGLTLMNRDGSGARTVKSEDLFAEPKTGEEVQRLRFVYSDDGEAYAYAAAGNEIAALDEDLGRLYSAAAEEEIRNLWFLPDGKLAFGTGIAGNTLWTLDREERKAVPLADHSEDLAQIICGPGADYYLSDRTGIRAVRGEERVFLLDKQNSAFSDSVWLIGAAAPDVFVGSDMDRVEDTELLLYRRGEDIDLSSVKVIEIANAMSTPNRDIEIKIAEYNRTHPEVRAVLTDAVERDGVFETDSGRLRFNLANGFYKPDIVLTGFGSQVTDVMLAKNLCLDLTPYLEKDPDVRLDDLFGAVRATFTDENGGLWGIAPEFYVSTAAGLKKALGKYARGGTWTLAEELDFLGSLPAGTAAYPGLSRESWSWSLLGPAGYNRWIDYEAGECHFDAEDFGRLLSFLASLPKTREEAIGKTGFWAGLSDRERVWDDTPYREGKIVLEGFWLQGFLETYRSEDRFGTAEEPSELCWIGYPTEDGRDTVELQADAVCSITRWCPDPDAAWDLIRTFFDDPKEPTEQAYASEIFHAMSFPVLKSAFDRRAEVFERYYLSEKIESDFVRSTFVAELPETGDPVPSEGRKAFVIRKDYVKKIRDFLDGASCTPYVDYTPGQIEEIVTEEISAFLGGGADADRCVRNIQSRVKIWLAEHR